MVEVKEVLRLWMAGVGRKRIAAQFGLDPKTVRRYVRRAARTGLHQSDGETALTDERVGPVAVALKAVPTRPHGAAWVECVRHAPMIPAHLKQGVRPTKIRKLLRRYAIAVLGFGRTAPTLPVADCEPGQEVQLDTGWMTMLEPDTMGRRRRFRAWIFTAVRSRHRFVYPCFAETTHAVSATVSSRLRAAITCGSAVRLKASAGSGMSRMSAVSSQGRRTRGCGKVSRS